MSRENQNEQNVSWRAEAVASPLIRDRRVLLLSDTLRLLYTSTQLFPGQLSSYRDDLVEGGAGEQLERL